MRSLLARLAVLGAFAVTMTACGGGIGTSLPFAGNPNAAGGSGGTLQSGSNGAALLRFVNGSPQPGAAAVDVCVDNLAFNVTAPSVNYGQTTGLYAIAGGIPHTVAVYTKIVPSSGSVPGSECATAPGPYFGSIALAVTTLSPANDVRQTVVLGGTGATFGLYAFTEPTFVVQPSTDEVISHNAAPAYSAGKTNGVGFGQCTTTVTPCAVAVVLPGANGLAAPKIATATAAVLNSTVTSPINAIPPGLYDGIGVPAGSPVPITSIAAPNAAGGQPYVLDLYAVDAPAGGLNLVAVPEQTTGFGF